MKRWLGWLVAGLIWCTQGGAAEAPPQGSLVIIGGALRADNAVVWQRIVQLSGGTGARIAVLPTAAGNPNVRAQYCQLSEPLRRRCVRGAAGAQPEAARLPH
jgi:hypothetical protein